MGKLGEACAVWWYNDSSDAFISTSKSSKVNKLAGLSSTAIVLVWFGLVWFGFFLEEC